MKDTKIEIKCDICKTRCFVVNDISIPIGIYQIGGVDPNEMHKNAMHYKEIDICLICLEKFITTLTEGINGENLSDFLIRVERWNIENKWLKLLDKIKFDKVKSIIETLKGA